MDRLRREGNPPTGQLASPVPQYKDTVLNDWAELQGEGGASYVKDRDALAKLEQARVLLSGVATEAKLEEARALLESVAGKDFATQATLAQVKSELELVKAELATIKANQLSGDQKVQLSGTIDRQAFGYTFGANRVVAVGDEVKSSATANEVIPLDISNCNHIQVYFKNLSSVNFHYLKLHFTHDLQPRPLTYEGGVGGVWFTESIAGVVLPNTEYWVYVDTTNPDKTDFLHRKAMGLILEWTNLTPSGRSCDYSIIGGV